MSATQLAMHVSLHVSDLPASVSFYESLFGVQATKLRAGYGKFELSEPPLVLSLLETPGRSSGGSLSHLGMRVGSPAELARERERVQQAGLKITLEEAAVDCCFASQDKFWVPDPDGNAWEYYLFLKDVEQQPAPEPGQACCGPEMACSTELC